MVNFYRCTIFLHSCLSLWFVAVPLPSCSFQPTKNHKTTKKAVDRFTRWTNEHQDRPGKTRLLWIDGNNVRGVGKFEWNAVELQQRVARFCHKYKIPNAIVVWDHGNDKFSYSARYCFSESDTTSPVTLVADIDDDSKFCVNLLILFSGLRQRADDVIVRESNHLIASTFQDNSIMDTKLDWASLAFVTNDRELNYKLRQQVNPTPNSIRLSRRKRRDDGRKYDYNIDPAKNCVTEKNQKSPTNPLFCDSTGFVNLLCELPGEYDMGMSTIDTEASELINEAKSSIRSCSQSRRRGYNPRREKTWERCVQAETLRRFLGKILRSEDKPLSDVELPLELNENATFIAKFIRELESSRGFPNTLQAIGANKGHAVSLVEQFTPYLGPTRLDRHQRRSLDCYNTLLRKEE